MKRYNSISNILLALIAGVFLLSSCSKNDKEKPQPSESGNYAKADINFITDNKKVSFSATGFGALAGITKEGSLVMILRDAKSPMGFLINVENAKKGTFSHEDGTLDGGGIFFTDTAQGGLRQIYFIGEDNIDDNDDPIDGKMTITISSITKDHIKGTFTTTMVLNSTIKEDGEVLEGEIKKAIVTKGSFNCGRVKEEDLD